MTSEKTLKAETLEKQNANAPLVFKNKKGSSLPNFGETRMRGDNNPAALAFSLNSALLATPS